MSRIPVSERFGLHCCHGGCDNSNTQSYARKITQLFHVSVHEVPGGRGSLLRQVRLMGISACFLFWMLVYPPSVQLRSLVAACLYTLIEYTFTWFSDGKSFTSFAQWWGNLLYTPILLDIYWQVIVGTQLTTPSYDVALVYVLLFPFNVWLLEIVLDQWFVLIYGRNVAWCYCTYSDSYVGGSVRLGHGIFWIVMGMGCLAVYPTLRSLTDGFTWSMLGSMFV